MTISLSKRSFLKGLFVAPAIVAATNLMPVKVMESFASPMPQGFGMRNGLIQPVMAYQNVGKSLITDLTDIQEASVLTTTQWNLIDLGNGNKRWITNYNKEAFKFKGDLIRTIELDPTNREIDTTITLMKTEPGSAVIWEIPSHMRSFK